MRLKLIIAALCLCSAASLFAEVNYRVTSSSRLNVRRSPSTTGTVLGTFKSGQEITVLSINHGWAKVEFNNSVGYVSAKYITELPKKVVEEPEEVEELVEVVEEQPVEETPIYVVSENNSDDISTPITIGSSLTDKLSLYLTVQGGVGYSNFIWGDGDVNGDISYSADIVGQLYFEDNISFIPRNWYSELALGFDKKGAADFGMNYIHARIYPLGYRISLSPVNVVVKGGVSLGFPLNDLETYSNSWSADFQCGVGGGFQVEWKQFAIGCNIEYDFTEVSSSCSQSLNNIAILGTISYKFAQFGHKK
ncbi:MULTISPECIES: SH3 domain-containing protein [Bacteroides]|uniref:SH3 domain-containing protein n=2 Tax=Bacteroidales TaxID=171549 RepID=UPI0026487AA1|nr:MULTISPECIES: SH3 domain-containing protein [Bacteroides]